MNEKKVRVPKSADSILAGALKLPLADRAMITDKLKASIQAEVKDLQALAAEAVKIANGSASEKEKLII